MGLLDDAIKEHLELKRRRGADPSEIAREEAEALGPVRREAVEPTDSVADDLPAHEQPAAGLEDPAAAYAEEPFHEPDPLPAAEAEGEPTAPPEADPVSHQPTREFSAHELDEALGEEAVAPDEEGEDVLEETPEFLQETPEHDRLWFEQRPPKDFDF